MNHETHSSMWLALTVGIVGLVVGYGIAIARQPMDIFARANSCPIHENTGVQCNCSNKAQCNTQECAASCPACAGKAA